MKLTIIYLTFTLFLAACGQQSSSTPESNVSKSGYENGQIQVVLIIPDPTLLGAATRVSYNNNSYLIGSGTTQQVRSKIATYAQGSYTLNVNATFAEESGLFPNPTATFDVINMTSITQNSM